MSATRRPSLRIRGLVLGLPFLAVTACAANTVAPQPVGPPTAAPSSTVPAAAPSPTTASGIPAPDDVAGAQDAVRQYLRAQARAVNAGVTDPGQLPEFTSALTPAALDWAVPLLAANLGDVMPGPYPVGFTGAHADPGTQPGDERLDLDVCLQDRGWQRDRRTGGPLAAAHWSTARAVVVRAGQHWRLADLVAGTDCSAEQIATVTTEEF